MDHRVEIDKLLDAKCHLEVEEWTTRLIDSGVEYDWAYFMRGVARFRMKHYREAFEDFDLVVNYNGRSAVAVTNRGVARANLNDFDGAEADYRRGIEIDAEYDHAWVCLGGLLHGRYRQLEKAKEVFDHAISINAESEAWAGRAEVLLDLNRLEEAEADAIEALRLVPDDAYALLVFGEIQSAFGHRSLFYEYLEKAVKLEPRVWEDINEDVLRRHFLDRRFQELLNAYLEKDYEN